MESTRKSVAKLFDLIADRLRDTLYPQARVSVAVSGGVDSMVLLYMASQVAKTIHIELSAIHVHHQLQQANDDMQERVSHVCAQWNIPLTLSTVSVDLNSGLGLENAAREARYRVFKGLAVDFLLLGHHLDDQAETFLTQLFRGSGLPGLAAMPEKRLLEGTNITLFRPLLATHKEELIEFAKQTQLLWIDDPSNQNEYYVRNYIRQVLAPVLTKKFPSWTEMLARSAGHVAKAQDLLEELAKEDLGSCQVEVGLDGEKVIALGENRAANVLRYWLSQQGLPVPQVSQWQVWWQQVTQRQSSQRHPRLDFAGISLVCDHGCWQIANQKKTWMPMVIAAWSDHHIAIDGVGVLSGVRMKGQGVKEALLQKGFVLQPRQGGERLKLDHQRPTRELKKLFQELAVPLWQRNLWPCVLLDQQLLAVPNIGVQLSAQAQGEEWGIVLKWDFLQEHGQACSERVKI